MQKKKYQIISSQKFAHISIDDFIETFKDITINEEKYSSIFENVLLKKLRDLHKEYGIVVSCYTYYQNDKEDFDLSKCTNKFAKEFEENSEWLKFGFHTKNGMTDYEFSESEIIKEDYDKVIAQILRITQSEECIDRVIRLQNYKANEEGIKAIKQTQYGILGLLGADDTRKSYSLNNQDNKYLYKNDYFEDKNNISYFRTDIRIEKINDIEELWQEITLSENCENTNQILILFTHE